MVKILVYVIMELPLKLQSVTPKNIRDEIFLNTVMKG